MQLGRGFSPRRKFSTSLGLGAPDRPFSMPYSEASLLMTTSTVKVSMSRSLTVLATEAFMARSSSTRQPATFTTASSSFLYLGALEARGVGVLLVGTEVGAGAVDGLSFLLVPGALVLPVPLLLLFDVGL